MKKLLVLFFFTVSCLLGQSAYTIVTALDIQQQGGGGLLSSGTLCFIPQVTPYTVLGQSASSSSVCFVITAGQIPTNSQLGNTAYITPQGFSWEVVVRNASNTIYASFYNVQVTGSTWSFDNYAVSTANSPFSGYGTPTQACQVGATYTQIDGVTGQNTWTCVALNNTNQWYLNPPQIDGSGGGGGGSGVTPGGSPGQIQINVGGVSLGGINVPLDYAHGGTNTTSPSVTCTYPLSCPGTWPNLTFSFSGSTTVYYGTPYQEAPSGTTNGTNPTFTLTNTPNSDTLILTRNGIIQKPSLDYTLSGNTITFLSGAIPETNAVLYASYQYGTGGGGGGGSGVPANSVVLGNSSGVAVNGAAAVKNVNNRAVLRDDQNALDNGDYSTTGIASSISACGTTTQCQVIIPPAYPKTEQVPGISYSNWYDGSAPTATTTSSNITIHDLRWGGDMVTVNNCVGYTQDANSHWCNYSSYNYINPSYMVGYDNLGPLVLTTNFLSGGRNVNQEGVSDKTFIGAALFGENAWSVGEHIALNEFLNCYATGDCIAFNTGFHCYAGRNDATGEGCELADNEGYGPVVDATMTVTGVSGNQITGNWTQGGSTQGEGRYFYLTNRATYSSGYITGITCPGFTGPCVATGSGTSWVASPVKGTLGTAVAPTPGSTVTATVTPTFSVGSISGITTSTLVCIGGTINGPGGNFEMIYPSSVNTGAGTFTATFAKAHLGTSIIATKSTGGCGYGFTLNSENVTINNFNTQNRSQTLQGTMVNLIPILYATDSTHVSVWYSAQNVWDAWQFLLPNTAGASAWLPSTVYYAGSHAFNAGQLYVATTGGTSASSGGPTGTGSSITDGSVVWSWQGNFQYTDYLMADTYSVQLNGQIGNTVTLSPNAMGLSSGDTIAQAHAFNTVMTEGQNFIETYWPNPYFDGGGFGFKANWPMGGSDALMGLTNGGAHSLYEGITASLRAPYGVHITGDFAEGLAFDTTPTDILIGIGCPYINTCTQNVVLFQVSNSTSTPGSYSISASTLTSIVVNAATGPSLTGTATVTFPGSVPSGSYVGALWNVTGATNGGLNKTYNLTSVGSNSFQFVTTGVPNGTYNNAGLSVGFGTQDNFAYNQYSQSWTLGTGSGYSNYTFGPNSLTLPFGYIGAFADENGYGYYDAIGFQFSNTVALLASPTCDANHLGALYPFYYGQSGSTVQYCTNGQGGIYAWTPLGMGGENPTYSATPVFNPLIPSTHLVLTGNVTSWSFTSGVTVPDQTRKIFTICQDTTGGHTFTGAPGTVQGFMTVSTTPNTCSSQEMVYQYLGNFWGPVGTANTGWTY